MFTDNVSKTIVLHTQFPNTSQYSMNISKMNKLCDHDQCWVFYFVLTHIHALLPNIDFIRISWFLIRGNKIYQQYEQRHEMGEKRQSIPRTIYAARYAFIKLTTKMVGTANQKRAHIYTVNVYLCVFVITCEKALIISKARHIHSNQLIWTQ